MLLTEKMSAPTESHGLPGISSDIFCKVSCLEIEAFRANLNIIFYVSIYVDPVDGLTCHNYYPIFHGYSIYVCNFISWVSSMAAAPSAFVEG